MRGVTRTRRLQILISLGLLAALAVVLAIALGGGGGGSASKTPTAARTTAAGSPIDRLFQGIPENGLTLGSPNAPATLEEFVDPQCPFCAMFSKQVLPTLVQNYVRPGRLKLVLRPLAFIGKDSVTGEHAVVAAGAQDLAWPFLDVLYANQGDENSGYLTKDFLVKLGRLVRGFDPQAMLARMDAPAVTHALQEADARATQFKLDSTPSFLLTVDGGKPKPLQSNLVPGAFTRMLDAALGSQ